MNLLKNLPNLLLKQNIATKQTYSTCCCMKPRHLICFKNWTADMVLNIIRSAMNLKCQTMRDTREKRMDTLKNAKVMILQEINEPMLIMAVSKAATLLGAYEVNITDHLVWEKDYNGRVFSYMADAIFVATTTHMCVQRMADQASVPVMCMRSRTHATIQALATVISVIFQVPYQKLSEQTCEQYMMRHLANTFKKRAVLAAFGKTDDARKLLIKLRGSELLANEEIKEYQLASSPDEGKVTIRELLKNRLFLKGAVICIVLSFSSQANGYTVVFQYLQPILETTHTSVRSEIASVIVGGIQLVASLFTALSTDKFGRKIILITTTAGVAAGLVGLLTFFKVTEGQKEVFGFMNYLPLASIILIVFCQSAGISSVLWILMGELFEGRTRAIGSSLGILVATISGFGVSKAMPTLTSSIGPPMTYGLFAVICVLTIIFTAFFVPETKGKSFAEIQELLGNKRCDVLSNNDKVIDLEKKSCDDKCTY